MAASDAASISFSRGREGMLKRVNQPFGSSAGNQLSTEKFLGWLSAPVGHMHSVASFPGPPDLCAFPWNRRRDGRVPLATLRYPLWPPDSRLICRRRDFDRPFWAVLDTIFLWKEAPGIRIINATFLIGKKKRWQCCNKNFNERVLSGKVSPSNPDVDNKKFGDLVPILKIISFTI